MLAAAPYRLIHQSIALVATLPQVASVFSVDVTPSDSECYAQLVNVPVSSAISLIAAFSGHAVSDFPDSVFLLLGTTAVFNLTISTSDFPSLNIAAGLTFDFYVPFPTSSEWQSQITSISVGSIVLARVYWPSFLLLDTADLSIILSWRSSSRNCVSSWLCLEGFTGTIVTASPLSVIIGSRVSMQMADGSAPMVFNANISVIQGQVKMSAVMAEIWAPLNATYISFYNARADVAATIENGLWNVDSFSLDGFCTVSFSSAFAVSGRVSVTIDLASQHYRATVATPLFQTEGLSLSFLMSFFTEISIGPNITIPPMGIIAIVRFYVGMF